MFEMDETDKRWVTAIGMDADAHVITFYLVLPRAVGAWKRSFIPRHNIEETQPSAISPQPPMTDPAAGAGPDGEVLRWSCEPAEATEFLRAHADWLAREMRAELPLLPMQPGQVAMFVRAVAVGEAPSQFSPFRTAERHREHPYRLPTSLRPRVTPQEAFSALEGRGLA